MPTPAPAGERGPRFQISDGVGCEACHGGAGGWLASHYAVGATHAANVAHGMVAARRSAAPAPRAASTAISAAPAPGQFVDHQIMAAGHPRIAFELDLFIDPAAAPRRRRRLSSSARAAPIGGEDLGGGPGDGAGPVADASSPTRSAARTASSRNSISSTARAATAASPTIPTFGRARRPIRAGRSRRACRRSTTRT